MMIQDLLSKSITCSLTVALALSAAVVHATMYRWVDENGSVNYSDQPPANPSVVRQLTVIDEPRITKYEKRSVEIIENEKQRSGDAPSQAQDRATGTGTSYDTASLPPYHPEFDNPPGMSSQLPRPGLRSLQPEAVRDPCLRSSDPRCPEKNRAAYVPYLGYAPSAAKMRGSESSAIGSTSAVGATGTVGGAVPASPTVSTRSAPNWRQSLKDAKDLK